MEDVQVETKQCVSCKCIKSLDEFYRNRAMQDGRTIYCKTCIKETTQQRKDKAKEYYRNNREKIIAQSREYRRVNGNRRRHDADAKKRHTNGTNKYKKENPIKVKAQSAVYTAVLKGDIPRAHTLCCSKCQQPATEYHHWSYEPQHWLDVVPLCHSCHMKIHSRLDE